MSVGPLPEEDPSTACFAALDHVLGDDDGNDAEDAGKKDLSDPQVEVGGPAGIAVCGATEQDEEGGEPGGPGPGAGSANGAFWGPAFERRLGRGQSRS